MNHTYPYPRPSLTVDAIVFRKHNNHTEVLLIRRAKEPYKDCWAFPGGFIDEGETAEEAVVRELEEETGLTGVELEQFYTASKPGRDPRGWTVSVVFIALFDDTQVAIGADDASEAKWFALNKLPQLAFDHDEILQLALKRNRNV